MKKSLLTLSIIAGIILISIPVISAQSDTVEIPSWIKGVANFWVEGGINDEEFAEALEFLIDSNIIQLGNSVYRGIAEMEQEFQDKFDAQEKDWEEKLETQNKKNVDGRYSDSLQWKTISDEYDAEIQKLKDDNDKRITALGVERDVTMQEKDAEIQKLKDQLNEK